LLAKEAFFFLTFARASFLLLFLLILIKIASKRQNKRQGLKNKNASFASKGRYAGSSYLFIGDGERRSLRGKKISPRKEDLSEERRSLRGKKISPRKEDGVPLATQRMEKEDGLFFV
jgi:hypothetical protein